MKHSKLAFSLLLVWIVLIISNTLTQLIQITIRNLNYHSSIVVNILVNYSNLVYFDTILISTISESTTTINRL